MTGEWSTAAGRSTKVYGRFRRIAVGISCYQNPPFRPSAFIVLRRFAPIVFRPFAFIVFKPKLAAERTSQIKTQKKRFTEGLLPQN